MPLITLFTDASRCPHLGVGGWAAWAKLDGVTMKRSGPLRGLTRGSHDAELMALTNGLHCVVKHFAPSPGTRIIAQTDSLQAIGTITGALNQGRDFPEVRGRWLALVRDHGLSVELRHVKAHRRGVDRRSWVNEWADREAKGHMRALRALQPVAPD